MLKQELLMIHNNISLKEHDKGSLIDILPPLIKRKIDLLRTAT